MSKHDYDLLVLGGGSGGLAGAFRAAEHGARVALLEPHELGGTCVNLGCVPKKAMWLAAEMAQRSALAAQMGFNLAAPVLDWPEFIVHRQRYIGGIHASYRKRLDEARVVEVQSHGRLVDAHTVQCEDGTRISAGRILIATGGRPRRPAIPGVELGIDSDGFFNLCAAPARTAIVGAGYVGIELAGVLQALGSLVEIFARGSCLLQGFERELTTALEDNGRQRGLQYHFGFDLASVERAAGDGVVLVSAQGQRSERFDSLILATGRIPNTGDMGLEQVGVHTDAHGFVQVDGKQDTNVDGISAVGDVTGQLALTPVAIAAARRLMDRLFGGKPEARLDYDKIATVVFSHPPLGSVGLTEAQARERHGDAVTVYRSHFRPMLHALADSPQRSLFKLVCVGPEQHVVGLHLLGEDADEILQGFAVALKKGITKADLDDTMAIHPTAAEEIVLMR